MAFISDTDLSAFLGDPALVGDSQAVLAAAMASGYVAELIGNPAIGPAPVTFTDLVIDGPRCPSGVFVLDGFPVANVASVALSNRDGTWNTPLVRFTDYDWNANGVVSRGTFSPDATIGFCFWPSRMNSIKITYTVGTGVVPNTVKLVCLGIAARLYSNPMGLLSEQISGYQIKYGTKITQFLGMDHTETAMLANYMDWGIA